VYSVAEYIWLVTESKDIILSKDNHKDPVRGIQYPTYIYLLPVLISSP